MIYFDRHGRRLTYHWWRYRYGRDRYRILRKTEFDDGFIDTSWIGVAMEWEEIPKIFLTESLVKLSKKKFSSELIWSATEEEALMIHEAAIFDRKED